MKNNALVLILFSLLFYLPTLQAKTFYVTDKVLVGVYEQASTDSNLIKALPTGTPIEVLERNGEYAKVRSPDGTTGWVENSYLIDRKPAQLVVLDLTDQQKQLNEKLSLAQAELEATQKQLADVNAKTSNDASDKNKKLNKEIGNLQNKTNKLKKELAAVKKQLQNKSQQHIAVVKQNKQLQETIIALRKKKTAAPAVAPAKSPTAEKNITPETDNKELISLRAQNKQLTTTLNQVRNALNLPASSISVNSEEGITLKLLWLLLGSVILAISGFIAGIKWLDWRNLKRHGGFRI